MANTPPLVNPFMPSTFPHTTGPRYTSDGRKVADGILDYSGVYYRGWAPADLQTYLNRGLFVDAACNLLAQGESLHTDTIHRAAQEGWIGFIEAYRQFQTEHHWVSASCGIHVVNVVEKYQGTYDQLGNLDGHYSLLDLKTGNVPNFCGLQLAAYALALNNNKIDLRLKRYGLELHGDGSYQLVPFNDLNDYNKFRILVRAYHISREYGD